MSDIESKRNIIKATEDFQKLSLTNAGLNLFNALGYITTRQAPFTEKSARFFVENYARAADRGFDEKKALCADWTLVDLLFQLTKDEVGRQQGLFDSSRVDDTIMESYLFFAVELARPTYTRSELARVTREINKVFPMPVMVVFRYGEHVSLAIIDRRLNKKDDMKDVLEKKVTLIKDIRCMMPHRAHVEILYDLSFGELERKHTFRNFVELHKAWRSTLDISALNKKFYLELSNWYFWALGKVRFPDDLEKDSEIRNATNLIRLITRVIFVWFIREKQLVGDVLFQKLELQKLLKGFCAHEDSNTYYPAILQNLFFGTLNQKMDERGFSDEGDYQTNKSHYGVKNLYRHAGIFQVSQAQATALFKDVPFLNGGLFDCLDKEDDQKRVQYVDGFSRNPAKQAFVPDFLFFDEEHAADLNDVLGTKGKTSKVKGLINILQAYKFTIAENTPVEEEVALDPELLGKVFENLLASYNPETRTTARNKTGSFYTPREIVDYMVDETLKGYLGRKLKENAHLSAADAQAGLDILFMYTEQVHAFTDHERDVLIEAIDSLKILDPACGSGAFPMGILHKLVYILHKLDSRNELWKQRQLTKAQSIDDADIRDRAIDDIEQAFTNNELDYGRKLYLIENCIFGVDIQPIAVQIAKLRCFISLVIDQNKKLDKENLGIRSLPNLETKFVAADSLITLKKTEGGLLRNPEIDTLEATLKTLRHQYFSARSRKDKMAAQDKDKALRHTIAELLEGDGMSHKDASLVAGVDPYDQNAHTLFFDPEWMFGVTGGFDVVIGNPPYVQIQSFSGKPEQARWEAQGYKTYAKTGDIYCLFYERGFGLLAPKGSLCYITSNKWMKAGYGKKLREFFATKTAPLVLIDFVGYQVFESACVDTNILVLNNGSIKNDVFAVGLGDDYTVSHPLANYVSDNGHILKNLGSDAWLISHGIGLIIKKRIESVGTPLKDWDIHINYGIKTGLNEAFIIDQARYDELVVADPRSKEILKPILRGRDIKRYKAEWAGLYLVASHNGYRSKGKEIQPVNVQRDYPAVYQYLVDVGEGIANGTIKVKGKGLYDRDDQGKNWWNLRDCAYWEEFGKERVIYAETMRVHKTIEERFPRFSWDAGHFYCDKTGFSLSGKNAKYLLSIFNSNMGEYLFYNYIQKLDAGGFNVQKIHLELLPIPRLSTSAPSASPRETSSPYLPYEILVDCIQFARAHELASEADVLEAVIDVMVYGLYFEPEMKAAGCYINTRIAEVVQAFKVNDTDDFKASYVRKLADFCQKDAVVYNGLIQSRTVDVVRTILGEHK